MAELVQPVPEAPKSSPTTIPHLIARQVTDSARHAKVGAPSTVDLAEAIAEVTIETTTSGASFIVVDVIDHDWKIQTSGFLTPNAHGLLPAIDVNFPDGSNAWWRLCSVDGSTDTSAANLHLTLEDRIVAYLRERFGPKTVPPGTTTRAQFLKSLADEVKAGGGIRFVCPELNQIQPVEVSVTQTETTTVQTPAGKATTTTKVSKSRGVHPAAAVTVKGVSLDSDQLNNVNTVLGVCNALNAGPKATKAIVCAGIGESQFKTHNTQPTTKADGVFQLIPSTAQNLGLSPFDTAATAKHWLQKGYYKYGGGLELARKNKDWSPGTIATAVEGSYDPPSQGAGYYDQFGQEADAIIAAYGGASLGTQDTSGDGSSSDSATPVSDVSQLTRGTTDNPDENSWDCMTRLAGDVEWSLFSNVERLYYMTGADLIAQKPACYIDRAAQTATNAKGEVARGVIASLTYTYDDTAFTGNANGQRRSRTAKPATPTEVRLNMLCGIDDYRGGDVFVLRNCGAIDGRWIVTDATRACLADLHTQFTLSPPITPSPEPQAQKDPSATTPNPGDPPPGAPGAGGSHAPAGGQVSASGRAFPMPPAAAADTSRWTLDQGVDIAAAAHTPLFAVGAGTIVGHGITGFGNDAPILKLDHPVSAGGSAAGPAGPLNAHEYVYYGHAGPGNAVSIGTHVGAGATISEVGAGRVGISSGPHLEIGFCDAHGTPVPGTHDAMHRLLMATFAPISSAAAKSPH